MAFLETMSFCGIEEYKNSFNTRATESELQVDELYMLMLHLDTDVIEAAKQAVRMLEVNKKSGFAIVRFAFLDDNLEEGWVTSQKVRDGVMHDFDDTEFNSKDMTATYFIEEGHFKNYFDDQFEDYMTTDESQFASS